MNKTELIAAAASAANVSKKDAAAVIDAAIAAFKAGTLKVYDVTKDNYITVNGEKLTTYLADVDTDAAFEKDTEVVLDGFFNESSFRSAPYFDILIDGIENINTKY